MSKNHIFQGVRKKVEKKSFFSSFFQFYCFLSELKQFGHGNSFSLHCSPFSEKKKLKILRMEHCKGSIGKKFSQVQHTPPILPIFEHSAVQKTGIVLKVRFSAFYGYQWASRSTICRKKVWDIPELLQNCLFLCPISTFCFFSTNVNLLIVFS